MAAPLPLEQAQDRILAQAAPLPVEHVDTASTLGRYLAEPLLARRTQPACDLSAMDGYAVLAGDLAGPWAVSGESAAGRPFTGELLPGQAVRISTGAVMPAAAGAVILQEDVVRAGNSLTLTGTIPHPADRHIRRSGFDYAAGAALAPAGRAITPALIVLALAAGHRHLPVRRLPRVAIIDCGDELSADPADCAPHQIPASNGAMLAAMAAAVPCEVSRIGPLGDTTEQLLSGFAAAGEANLIVTSGGASVGDHDLLIPALERWGAAVAFWKVAIKPGKPLLFATRPAATGLQLILGLPGNPVSSYVTALHFMLPLLRKLAGASAVLPRALAVPLGCDLPAGGPRREFLRAVWEGDTVTVDPVQDSSALLSLARCNALIDRPAGAPAVPRGAIVSIFLLENGGIA